MSSRKYDSKRYPMSAKHHPSPNNVCHEKVKFPIPTNNQNSLTVYDDHTRQAYIRIDTANEKIQALKDLETKTLVFPESYCEDKKNGTWIIDSKNGDLVFQQMVSGIPKTVAVFSATNCDC